LAEISGVKKAELELSVPRVKEAELGLSAPRGKHRYKRATISIPAYQLRWSG